MGQSDEPTCSCHIERSAFPEANRDFPADEGSSSNPGESSWPGVAASGGPQVSPPAIASSARCRGYTKSEANLVF
jgi:hypothetical protein